MGTRRTAPPHPAVIPLERAATMAFDVVGRKASALGSIAEAGLPVPAGLVITTDAYRAAVAALPAGVRELPDADVGREGLAARHAAAVGSLRGRLAERALLADMRAEVDLLLATARTVAVRSSGTAEDAPRTTFAGLLETVLDLRSLPDVFDAVARCWASAFSPAVATYLRERGVSQSELEVAVIVQRQVHAEKSGLAFSRDPTNRYASGVVVEAISGLGEPLVSGELTPERYVYSPVTQAIVAKRPAGALRPAARPATPAETEPPRLSDPEVAQLARWALEAEALFGRPQDMEWAFADGRFWVLQSRPIVFARREERVFPAIAEHTVLLRGSGVSPAVGSGRVLVMTGDASIDVDADTVAVLERLTNDRAVELRRAAGVIADEGGATSHGANILREFDIPCVIGVGGATRDLHDGDPVTVDGFRGVVYEGDLALAPLRPLEVEDTAMKVFVSVLVPERAATVADAADGVSSLRDDYFLLDSGVHPLRMIARGHAETLEETIHRGLARTAELFSGKPVWYKTMDAPTDEFRRLEGGEAEPDERNPLLGWRGIGRELAEPEMLRAEFGAVARAVRDGHENLGVKLPFVRFPDEVEAAERALAATGLRPHADVRLGISVEIPAVAIELDRFLDLGVDFVSVGLSDLTMCALALDRESYRVAELFDPGHPAVLELLARIAGTCSSRGVFCCVTGESARDERVLPEIVRLGFDAVGVSLSYFGQVKGRIAELETKAPA